MNADPRPAGRSILLTLALLLIVAFLALQLVETRRALRAGMPAALTASSLSTNTAPRLLRDLGAVELNTIAIYRRVSPAVVSVANKALVRSVGWFGSQLYEVPQGAGSG